MTLVLLFRAFAYRMSTGALLGEFPVRSHSLLEMKIRTLEDPHITAPVVLHNGI